jgi:hypothetical protein
MMYRNLPLLIAHIPALVTTLVVAHPGVASAALPVALNVNPALSRVDLTLTALGKSDTQASPLSGSLAMAVAAGEASLGDFHIATTKPMNFTLNFGFTGNGTAKVPLLELNRHDQPPLPVFVPIAANGAVTFTNLTYTTHGSGSYSVSGLVCSLVQGQGRPCSDDVDFDSGPPQVIDRMEGTLTFQAGAARLEATYVFSAPLDPSNPDLAVVTGVATLVATGPLPLRVDITAGSEAGTATLRWSKLAGPLQLAYKNVLGDGTAWTPVGAVPATDGEDYVVTVQASGPARFFRLQ